MSTGGSPSRAAAIPSRCRMPSENPPTRAGDRRASPTSPSTSPTRLRGQCHCGGASQGRWSARRPPRVPAELEQRARPQSEGGELRVAAGRSTSAGRRRQREPKQDTQRRGLPRPVRTDETRHDPGGRRTERQQRVFEPKHFGGHSASIGRVDGSGRYEPRTSGRRRAARSSLLRPPRTEGSRPHPPGG